jgi:hypothetical protein
VVTEDDSTLVRHSRQTDSVYAKVCEHTRTFGSSQCFKRLSSVKIIFMPVKCRSSLEKSFGYLTRSSGGIGGFSML